ncbi:MAG TPA: hypothetical protein VKD47_10180, partial [Miltoncostaeaceae bacterium]|nr:hypothetical protein [Miltoncostaeaceae bacterium]
MDERTLPPLNEPTLPLVEPKRARRRKWPFALGGLAVLALGALGAAQLALPRIAEARIRDRLDTVGSVRAVHVSAFPAIKLLFGHADSVRISMDRASVGKITGGSKLFSQIGNVGAVDARVDQLAVGPLVLQDARVEKRGGVLRATGVFPRTHLADGLMLAAVGVKPAPGGFDVVPAVGGDKARVR